MAEELTIWSGWKFTPVGDKPEGGYAYKYYLHRRNRNQLQWGVINILKNKAPSLVSGTVDSAIDDACIQEILQEIEVKRPGYELKYCRNFFVQGLDRGVREGLWNIQVPAPVFTVRRQKALFQPETFIQLPEIRRIQSLLEATWSDPIFFQQNNVYTERLIAIKGFKSGDDDKQLRAGQLLLTAILYGGLLDSQLLYTLPNHINTIQSNADCCWIDFFEDVEIIWESDEPRQETDKGKQLHKESLLRRRWFPDSATELLLLRWRYNKLGDFPNLKNRDLCKPESYCQYLINVFLKTLGFGKNIQLRDLINSAITATALELPAFLLNYAAGNIASTSLPPQAWQRLYSDNRGQQATTDLNLEQIEANLQLQAALQCDDRIIARYDQYQLYQKLSKLLTLKSGEKKRSHAQSIQIIQDFLQTHQEQIAPSLQRLSQWALYMYRNGSYTKARLAVSTVPKYLGQLKELVNVVGSEDPLLLEGDELLEIYQEMINSSKTIKAKAYKAGRIKEFHHYLKRCGYADSINFSELSGVKTAGSSVDANYINETAHQGILSELSRLDATNPRIVTARRLITTLGYRCGLRRTEAHKIRLCDIHLGPYPVLLVRANAYKTVKSTHSTRQIPLKPLLSKEELRELLLWVEYRRLEQALDGFQTDTSFLFSHDHNGQHLIEELKIFPVIQMVLRAVTGDQTTRYHHLRHSFANNLLVRLLGIEWPELAAGSPKYASEQDIEEATGGLFDLNNQSSSRKHLYQVSALLGHANPGITMKSYIHLCDYALRYYLNTAHASLLQVPTVTVLSGLGRDALYKMKERKYPALSILEIAKKRLRETALSPRSLVDHDTGIKQNEPIEWPSELLKIDYPYLTQEPSISILHQMIKDYDKEIKNSQYWSEKTGYPEKNIQAWLNAAAHLAEMKTGKGAPRHIRPQWYGLQDAEKKMAIRENEVSQPPRCMYPPHNQQDIKYAHIVFTELQKVRISTPLLAQWAVKYYLEHNIAHRSHLRMKTQDDAEQFKAFIVALGIPKRRIHCQLKPQSRPNNHSSKTQIQYWAKALGIDECQIALTEPIKKRGSEFGSLRMTIVGDKRMGSYGFQYGMYMMGILMLAADEIVLK